MPYPRKVPLKAPEGHVSPQEAMEFLEMSSATFYRYKKQFDDFPKDVKQGGKSWYASSDLESWKRRHME